jgi:hypothetical protein
MTFPDTDANERSDENFRTMQYEDHHTGVSPFMNVNVGCVSDFPLDYMHLVCLGVIRQTILLSLKGPLNCRLSGVQVRRVSDKLTLLRNHLPTEFCRRPRAFSEVNQWKAMEFRQFLLYTGVVVLLDVLPQSLYDNFELLVVSMTILLSPSLFSSSGNLDYVKELLKVFFKTYSQCYGQNQLIYNVHSITHLPDDARKHGALDKVSSFPFESYLGKLKKMVWRPQNPVAQIVRRVSEFHLVMLSKSPSSDSQHNITNQENYLQFCLKENCSSNCWFMYTAFIIAAGRSNIGVVLVRVLTLLEEVKETQRIHGNLLQSIMRQQSIGINEQPNLPEGVTFPLVVFV